MKSKTFGGILIILGTAIGAGMLALPMAAASGGFLTASLMLLGCWAIMTIGALCILEVVCQLPANTNMISMAKVTMGKPGQIALWISYLILLYAAMCSFISGTSDILQQIIFFMHINITQWAAIILVTFIFSSIIYRGIGSVDTVNRLLMFGKIALYVLLVLFVAQYIHPKQLFVLHPPVSTNAMLVMVAAYAFGMIIPSLRDYLNNDVIVLRKVILIGSIIPLFVYVIWTAVVQGIIPSATLNYLTTSSNAITGLAHHLSSVSHNIWVIACIQIFTSICALTSFLGIALSLFDFLADGLKLGKKGKSGLLLTSVVFIPPMLITLLFPNIFVIAMSYAGIFSVIILALFPALMVWSNRYRKNRIGDYKLWGGKPLLAIEIIISILLIIGAVIFKLI